MPRHSPPYCWLSTSPNALPAAGLSSRQAIRTGCWRRSGLEPATARQRCLADLRATDPVAARGRRALDNLGNCLCELGRERDALAPFWQTALRLQRGGSGAELHYALARAWLAHGDAGRALEHVQRALQQYPQDPEFQLLRARVLVMLDEYESAGQAIDALRRGDLAPTILIERQSVPATGSVRGRRRVLQRGPRVPARNRPMRSLAWERCTNVATGWHRQRKSPPRSTRNAIR